MIGRLRGIVVECREDAVLLDVGGVGYVVHCSTATLARIPPPGETLILYTDLLVREDLMQLSGFLHPAECDLYRALLTVQGVGVRAAQSIVGTLGVRKAIQAISLGDWNAITAAQYIGKRIAQRVVNELKEKSTTLIERAESYAGFMPDSGAVSGVDPGEAGVGDAAGPVLAPDHSGSVSQADCILALVNLGYSRSDATRAVVTAVGDADDLDTEQVIRVALRSLGGNAER
ncbi:MAG: Holliday junction branch migration protein RuvA [Rhodobacteraceae bacterium]|nr:Holliday junction branch migration protein RuvA [Paracoccaceae bacterium]